MTSLRARSLRHVRPVVPLHFPASEPESERMGQGTRHYQLCKALYEILRAAAGPGNTVACDAFVYFDAGDADRKLAPDGMVKLGVPQHEFQSWLAWEKGAPELAVEILSPSDAPERWAFEEKLARYRTLGVQELVVFHVEGEPGSRLRVWDRIDGDLVERIVEREKTASVLLGGTWVVAPTEGLGPSLRYARDAEGVDLIPTTEEVASAAQAAGAATEAQLRAEAIARREAEDELREVKRRIAELESSKT